jgi:hypothetical protein
MTMMKNVAFAVLLVATACGPKPSTSSVSNGGSAEPTRPAQDTRTEIEKRRDAACESLGPRVTSCALDDTKADYAAGKVSKAQFDKDTAPGILEKNTEKYVDECIHASYSSRQIRVLEVCQKEETECEPLLACLDNVKPKQ